MTKELIDRIFKEPGIKYELTEFETLGKPIHEILSIFPKTVTWYETGSGAALMHELRQAKLTAKKIPENDTLKDEDHAWEYFEHLKFDVILTNPPFAGEMKDRKMLAHYELAKPALKRAKDKSPKEERDVLFIERVLKMLKPGGRAAIVLPQGKFNNSSLAFIREWILKRARLLAVVGLHPNTFKPHTGTKTSVLFFQKYTPEALSRIEQVKQEVANACPDYEQKIKDLIAEHLYVADVPEEKLPEEIADLMAELLRLKQKLVDLESDIEALQQKREMESAAIARQWEGAKAGLQAHLNSVKANQKAAVKQLNEKQKVKQRTFKVEIKHLEKAIPDAEAAVKLVSNRGKLELILADPDLIGTLKERWIAAGVAKRLDYPIFMAVSERGGKNNSGDYEYLVDEAGSLVEFPDGHPLIEEAAGQ
jgi:type I restriction enzyme M protein